MRDSATTVLLGVALMLSASAATAADVRVLSVGSVQIAAKALAADFTKATGNKVTGVSVTLLPVALVKSAASALAAICTDPTLRTRTSAAVAALADSISATPSKTVVALSRIPSSQAVRFSLNAEHQARGRRSITPRPRAPSRSR